MMFLRNCTSNISWLNYPKITFPAAPIVNIEARQAAPGSNISLIQYKETLFPQVNALFTQGLARVHGETNPGA